MKCALCKHRGTFPKVGFVRDGNHPLFRCPLCKYDQTKNLFGIGQVMNPLRAVSGRDLELFVPPETSPIKRRYEQAFVDSGLLPADQVTPLDEASAHDFMANLAQESGNDRLADALRGMSETAGRDVPAGTPKPQDDHLPRRTTNRGHQDQDRGVLPQGVSGWDQLTRQDQDEHRRRVVDALDDVIDQAMGWLQLSASDMNEPFKEFFIQFSRLIPNPPPDSVEGLVMA